MVWSNKRVLQGSILGPLLFIILGNDMFHFVDKYSLYNYADNNPIFIIVVKCTRLFLSVVFGWYLIRIFHY